MSRHPAVLAWTACAVLLAAGCATPPPPAEPAPPVRAAPAPAPPPAPSPVPAAEPVPERSAPSSLALLETILTRVGGDSGVQISRTSTGALLLRATGDAAFGTASAVLSPRFRNFLQQLANGLGTYPTLATKVSGHTDSVGDAQLNDKLSAARANATIAYLVSLGVPASRLVSEGKGSREPIAGNDTAEGRAANRRVDLLIIELGS